MTETQNNTEQPPVSPEPAAKSPESVELDLLELTPLPPIPEEVPRGWQVFVDGEKAEVSQIVFHNTRMGTTASYGLNGNGEYDTVQIDEPGGPVTIPYVHDAFGGLFVGLVQEDRPNMGGKIWNVPRGMVDPGESLEEAQRRELAEETGHEVKASHPSGLHPEQLSRGGNPNSAYFKTGPDNPDQGYSVFALEFKPKDLIPIRDSKGVVIGYTLTTRQKAIDANKEKIYDMTFVNVQQALQMTRDGYTAAAIGHLLAKRFGDEVQGASRFAKIEAVLDDKELQDYKRELAAQGITWSGAYDPRHSGRRYDWREHKAG